MKNVCQVEGCDKRCKGRTCSMHRMRMASRGTYDPPPAKSLSERFWEKVTPAAAEECWPWAASKNQGYGRLTIAGSVVKAHRVAYELLFAEIPEGLDLDHLCRNRACVNPWHLDPVTTSVNSKRAAAANRPAACPHGHVYDDENTGWSRGTRYCKPCHRAGERRRRLRGAA